MINFILFIIGFLLLCGAMGGIYLIREKNSTISIGSVLIMMVLSVIMIILSDSFRIVKTGYTGVRTTFGQIDSSVIQNGFNFKIPFVQSINKVNNKQQDQEYKEEIWGEAADKTAVYAKDIVVTYQINPERSAYIYANVSDYTRNLVPQALVVSAVKSAMVQLPSDQVTNRNKIEALTKASLEKAISEKYNSDTVNILKVTISSMDFEDSYNTAIANKQIARQEAEKQQIENQRAIEVAKANQEKASIEAETRRISAQADADAMIIAAKGEAEAYRIKSAEITDNLLKKWELDARNKHGWITIQGANTIVTKGE